jgi:hypothetical protein
MRITSIEAIQYLLLKDPSISTDEIEVRLAELGFHVPTRFLTSQTRMEFLRTLKFLQLVGVVDPDPVVSLPQELKRLFRQKLRRNI